MDWTSEHLRFYYDGKLVAVHTKSMGDAVPQGPEYFSLKSDSSDAYDYGYFEVDYVRCYQRPGEGSIGRAPFTDENMMDNGGFEAGNMNGWTVENGQANVANVNPRWGQYSLNMNGGAVVSQKTKGLVTWQKYRLTAWVSASGVDDTVSVELRDYSLDNNNNWFTPKKETVRGSGYQKVTFDFVMHSYWKWPTIAIKNNGSGIAYVDDIEIVQLNDLALHKPASASSILNNNLFYEPQKAVDGYENTNASTDNYLNTPWRASSTKWSAAGDGPHWLMVDLKNEQTIRSYQVRHAGTYEDGQVNTRDFVFQVSNNGVNWTTLDTVTGNLDNVTQHNVEPSNARYVRLYITNPQTEPGNKAARIYEFSVFDTYFDKINDLSGDIIVNDNSTGGSNNQFNYSGSWTYDTFSKAYGGDNHFSNTTNNYYTVAFNGTQIKLYGCKTPNNGIAAISIDGGAETYVDCYSSIERKFELLYASPILSSGQHTLKVRVTGTKNINSSDYYVNADMIDIVPTTVTVNDNSTGTGNNQFNYSGSWNYNTFIYAYNGDNHYSNTTNNYYTVKFNGTKINLYSCKTPNNGIAAISIDGGAETCVDLYSSATRNSELIYTSPTLSNGQHTLKVRVTGSKNNSSSDRFVNADRVDIAP